MLFRMIYDEALAHASYLIGCQRTGEAIVFDPSRDIDQYLALASRHGLRIVATAETHIHADFLSGCGELARCAGAHVYVSDLGGDDWRSQWVDAVSHTRLREGEVFTVGGIQFRVLHLPGHTPEHVVFEVTDTATSSEPLGVITGDVVFVGAMGRPDLLETELGVDGAREASARQLFASARKVLELPDFLQVWPAHGSGSACGKALGAVPQSTIGYERRTNPALLAASTEDRFIDDILEGQPDPPLYFARMKTWNRDGVPPLYPLTPPPFLSAEEAAGIDLSAVTVVDVRPWNHFRQCHARNSIWSAPGAWFPASVGSYLEPEDEIVLLADEDDAEDYFRLLLRLGLDRIRGVVTPAIFEAAAGTLETDQIAEVGPQELQEAVASGSNRILDVRGTDEFQRGGVPGSTHVPYTRLAARLADLPPTGEPILVHCQAGLRSAMAACYLRRQGYEPINVARGYAGWSALEQASRSIPPR